MTTDPETHPTLRQRHHGLCRPEQWRRWITMTRARASRFANASLMTRKVGYYRLGKLNAEDVARNPGGTGSRESTRGTNHPASG